MYLLLVISHIHLKVRSWPWLPFSTTPSFSPAPISMATIMHANSSGGCAPQDTWIAKAHWHTSQVPECKLCRKDACHYPILKEAEAEGRGLAVGVGSLWSSFPISFFCTLSRKLQKEPTAFLRMGPSFPSPYWGPSPKSSLQPVLPPKKMLFLYAIDQLTSNAALARAGRGICSSFFSFFCVNKTPLQHTCE